MQNNRILCKQGNHWIIGITQITKPSTLERKHSLYENIYYYVSLCRNRSYRKLIYLTRFIFGILTIVKNTHYRRQNSGTFTYSLRSFYNNWTRNLPTELSWHKYWQWLKIIERIWQSFTSGWSYSNRNAMKKPEMWTSAQQTTNSWKRQARLIPVRKKEIINFHPIINEIVKPTQWSAISEINMVIKYLISSRLTRFN